MDYGRAKPYFKSPSQARHFYAVNQIGANGETRRLESRGKSISISKNKKMYNTIQVKSQGPTKRVLGIGDLGCISMLSKENRNETESSRESSLAALEKLQYPRMPSMN